MIEKIGMLTVGLIIGAAGLFWFGPKEVPPEPTAWQGEIKPVQKQISVEVPASYSEFVIEHEGVGTGKAMMKTNHTLLIGVKFPDNWKFNAQKLDDGIVNIKLPKLSLLNEIKAEIENYDSAICNKPTGTQTRKMETDFRARAKSVFKDRSLELLSKSKNVYDLSRSAFEKYYLTFLNSVNKENPARIINVVFEGEPRF